MVDGSLEEGDVGGREREKKKKKLKGKNYKTLGVQQSKKITCTQVTVHQKSVGA